MKESNGSGDSYWQGGWAGPHKFNRPPILVGYIPMIPKMPAKLGTRAASWLFA